MCEHEAKQCARCTKPFECKPLDIARCQCSLIQLSDNERSYIQSRYDDCLCGECLKAIRQEIFDLQLREFKKRTPFA